MITNCSLSNLITHFYKAHLPLILSVHELFCKDLPINYVPEIRNGYDV